MAGRADRQARAPRVSGSVRRGASASTTVAWARRRVREVRGSAGKRVAEAADSGEAAEAGDEAVGVAIAGGGEGPDLDRGAEAFGRDGVLKQGQRGGVEGGAVAQEGEGVDPGEGEVVDVGKGIHGGVLFCAGANAIGVKGR